MPLFSFGSSGKNSHKYHCRVLLLDDSELTHEISGKTKGFELLDKVFVSLNLFEKDYFGLRFRDIDDKTQWLDPDKAIKKQIDSGPPYTLYFGVKFYAADPTKLKEELTRYQFFLQLKKDILQGRLPCTFNVAAELCAYAVQSELGDYDDNLHTENYISEFRFVPNQSESLEKKIGEIHQKLRGQVPSDSELNFLERVKWLEMYGVDLHPVRGQDNLEYFLGLTPTGIVLFRNSNKIGSFIWPKITKLKFKGHQFIIRVSLGKNDEEKEYTFSLETKHAAKQLWKYCAEHHTFFRLEKANDVPASAYNFLFKKGSGFRFSGRTQQELLEDSTRIKRPPPVVQRVQSKRYTRRPSVDESQNRVNRSNATNMTRSYISNGDVSRNTVYSIDGNGVSPPWEQRSNKKSGLYTSGHSIPASVAHETPLVADPVSARFPRPHKSTASLQGDGEIPKRKISSYHAGYSSGEEITARRKRSHYYSGYTSGVSDGESVHKMKHRAGSEPNMAYMRGAMHHGTNNRNFAMQQNDFYRQRQQSKESVATNGYDPRNAPDYRYYTRESGSKSDSEQNSRQRRQQQYYRVQRSRAGLSDTEMVPALNVYRAADGKAIVGDPRRRPKQQRHHHHHHHHHNHGRPRVPPQFDPENAKVLLELGPESAPPDSENSYGDSTVSSIPEEKQGTYQSHPANLNHSIQSDQSGQLNRSNHSGQMPNQYRISHPNQRTDQYNRNQPHPMQPRPVSADMKFFTAGYHYIEHGPRPVNSGPVNTRNYHPAMMDPMRMKMAAGQMNHHHHHHIIRHPSQENGMIKQGERNRYVQQYLPTHVINDHPRKDDIATNNNDKRQFVEQVVGPPPKQEAAQNRSEIESEIANYSISTEL
ncbi:band 4.1-like protein 4 isoform X1 [Rhopilema esculentum]|uniref:band 4.1-like protein 4 isoform X1 n=1 Tax=Rhopilema esculentum TaxID=499914 RepID=UPI0031DC923E